MCFNTKRWAKSFFSYTIKNKLGFFNNFIALPTGFRYIFYLRKLIDLFSPLISIRTSDLSRYFFFFFFSLSWWSFRLLFIWMLNWSCSVFAFTFLFASYSSNCKLLIWVIKSHFLWCRALSPFINSLLKSYSICLFIQSSFKQRIWF